jgi:ATP-dependent RNA helicase RhlB
VTAAASAPDAAPAADGGEGARKRRRRRGGRGRRREGGDNGAPQAQASTENRAPHGERKPPRERGAGPSRPSRQVAVQSAVESTGKKPGFFRRLTRLFTGR